MGPFAVALAGRPGAGRALLPRSRHPTYRFWGRLQTPLLAVSLFGAIFFCVAALTRSLMATYASAEVQVRCVSASQSK